MFHDLIFRQLFDAASSTYTYLLADPESRQAVLIDTVFEQHFRDLALVEELRLSPVAALDTASRVRRSRAHAANGAGANAIAKAPANRSSRRPC